MKQAVAAMLGVVVLAVPTRASAQACGPRARAWAEACSQSSGATVLAARCPKDRVILSVAPRSASSEPPTFVEAARDRHDALSYRRGVGLLPLGEFPDFRSAPQPVQQALSAVADCVERAPALPFDEAAGGGPAEAPETGPPLPWRLFAGLGLALLLAVAAGRRRACVGPITAMAALAAATLGVAYVAAPWTYFHQNGHGPNWIGYALGERCVYGPGFRELFGWVAQARAAAAPCWSARLSSGPESAVFLANGAMVALVPSCAWEICRRLGAPRALAWTVALAMAADPLLLRIAFTESYYAPLVALSFLATSIALSARSLGVVRLRSLASLRSLSPWTLRFAVATVAAGLVVAQAARVHPVGWIGLGIVPLAHLGRPGATRRLVLQASVATALVGGVVAATSWPSLIAVVRGEMGTQYLPEWLRASRSEAGLAIAAALGSVLLAAAWPRARSQVRVRLLAAGALVAAAALGTSLLRLDVDWVQAAHARLFAAPGVALFVGLAARRLRRAPPRARWLASGVLLGAALLHVAVLARWMTVLPTDALELRLAMGWRERIPCGATVAALERAGIMELQLPVYPPLGTSARDLWLRLDATGAPPPLESLGASGQAFYYRSSLCSTATGRAWCETLEHEAALEPIEEHLLPARLSANGGGYDAPIVRVGLYRILPRPRPGASLRAP
jgi:hypothetical protein